jgi:alpha-N-arabinofuranosidase
VILRSSRVSLFAVLTLIVCHYSVAQIRGELSATPSTIHVRVQTSLPHPQAIPPTIFGTFIEPVGTSIYGGLWAELLENPSFEPEMWSAPNVKRMLEERPELGRASDLGLPLPWEPLYEWQSNRYEPRRGNAANSNQSILVLGLPTSEVGIRQRIYLPVERELEYTGSLWAKLASGDDQVEISLRQRNRPKVVLARGLIHAASKEWTRYEFLLKLSPGQVSPLTPVDFVIAVPGDTRVLIDQASLMPADNVGGMDADVVRFSRELHAPLVRFGGNFTSGLHFEDGIGPKDKRVSMLNGAWGIPEYNAFGTDEFLHFCQLVGAQPQIALNLGSGTPEEAARWVKYVNAHWGDHSGGLVWELGNELWGNWNTGYPPVSQIAERTAQFSDAVRAVDPKAKLIANGADIDSFRDWNAHQLAGKGDAFNYLSTHFVVDTDKTVLPNSPPDFEALASLALPTGLERGLRDMDRQVQQSDHKNVRFAFTEWLFESQDGIDVSPNYLNLGGALDAAGFLNMLMRVSDIVPIADMTGTMDLAGILKRRGKVFVTPSYWAFRMFSNEHPAWLMKVENDGPVYSVANGVIRIPDIDGVPWLEIVAAETADRDKLVLFCVNRSLQQDIKADIVLDGFTPQGSAQVLTLSSPHLNDENSDDNPHLIEPKTSSIPAEGKFQYTFPHASVVVIQFAHAN